MTIKSTVNLCLGTKREAAIFFTHPHLIVGSAPLNCRLIKTQIKPVDAANQNEFESSPGGSLPVDEIILCRDVCTLEMEPFALRCGEIHSVEVMEQLKTSVLE